MNVSLIAIVSLGSPAYGYYDPYPVEAFYPEPAYEGYDPYYDRPYDEPYYGEPAFADPYYRPRRDDVGDVLLTFLGIALIGKVLDADVDFVFGYPYYPRYRPYGYPVVYRPYYVYDPWYYRPAYCYDPWYSPSVVVTNYWGDPYYRCSRDSFVVNNDYSSYSYPTSYPSPYLARSYDPARTSWNPVRNRWDPTRSFARLNSGLASSIPSESLASARSWKQDRDRNVSGDARLAKNSVNSFEGFVKGQDRISKDKGRSFSSRSGLLASVGPRGRNPISKGTALELGTSHSQKALKERNWSRKGASSDRSNLSSHQSKTDTFEPSKGHGRNTDLFAFHQRPGKRGADRIAIHGPQQQNSWTGFDRQSQRLDHQFWSSRRQFDSERFRPQTDRRNFQESRPQFRDFGHTNRSYQQPRIESRGGGFDRRPQFQPRQETRSWGGNRGGGFQQRQQFQPRQSPQNRDAGHHGGGQMRQSQPMQGGGNGRGRGH